MKIHDSRTYRHPTGCGNIYVELLKHRIHLHMGKEGLTCLNAISNAIERLVNKVFELHGRIDTLEEKLNAYGDETEQELRVTALDDVIDALNNVQCFKHRAYDSKVIYSCVDAIAHILKEHKEKSLT